MKETEKPMQLWEVSIWPNNQPPILLGEYYAYDAYTAKELTSIENKIPIDDRCHARLAGETHHVTDRNTNV